MYARNSEEWAVTNLAAMHLNVTLVGYLDVLGPDSIRFITNQTELTTIALTADKVPRLADLARKKQIPSLKNLLVFDEISEEVLANATAAGLRVYIYEELIQMGM